MQKDIPADLVKLIELLSDYNLSLPEVDARMGWVPGATKDKLNKFPILARTANEARVLAMRTAGLSKVESFKVIADAHKADDHDGLADHDIRLKAADRALALMGEKTVATSGPTVQARDINITITDPLEIDRLERIASSLSEITARMEIKTKPDAEIIDVEITDASKPRQR